LSIRSICRLCFYFPYSFVLQAGVASTPNAGLSLVSTPLTVAAAASTPLKSAVGDNSSFGGSASRTPGGRRRSIEQTLDFSQLSLSIPPGDATNSTIFEDEILDRAAQPSSFLSSHGNHSNRQSGRRYGSVHGAPQTPETPGTNATQRHEEAESVTIDGETVALRRWTSAARKLRRRVTLLSEDEDVSTQNTTDWGNDTQQQPTPDMSSLLGVADE
jgi:hypothetical protein